MRRLRQVDHGAHVHREQPLDVLVPRVVDRPGQVDAGVGNDRVDPSEAILRSGDRSSVHRAIGDIAGEYLDARPARRGGLHQLPFVSIDQHQIPAGAGECPGAGGADPVGRAGDDRRAHSTSPYTVAAVPPSTASRAAAETPSRTLTVSSQTRA